jgi:peroxiredoxin
MMLKEKLDALWDTTLRTERRDLTEAYQTLFRKLSGVDIVSQSLKTGDAMPQFLLPNVEGNLVDSSALLEKGPLVISFFRGEWCPFCTLELEALQAKLPDIERLGANLVAVTADTGAALRAAKKEHGPPFEVLSDVDHALGLQFGIIYRLPDEIRSVYLEQGIDLAARHGNDACLLPVPATFVVDQRGEIRHAYVDGNFTHRMEPQDIVEAVRAISTSPTPNGHRMKALPIG